MLRTKVTELFVIIFTVLLLVLSLPLTVYAQNNPSSSLLNYVNRDYNINIRYPANWTAQETNLEPPSAGSLFSN
jgi:hypothetical protein